MARVRAAARECRGTDAGLAMLAPHSNFGDGRPARVWRSGCGSSRQPRGRTGLRGLHPIRTDDAAQYSSSRWLTTRERCPPRRPDVALERDGVDGLGAAGDVLLEELADGPLASVGAVRRRSLPLAPQCFTGQRPGVPAESRIRLTYGVGHLAGRRRLDRPLTAPASDSAPTALQAGLARGRGAASVQ